MSASLHPPPRWPDRAAQLETLNEIARTATLELGMRPMLQRITDALCRGFGWELVVCALVDHARGVCVYEALSSAAEAAVTVGFSHPVTEGVAGEVARTGTTRGSWGCCWTAWWRTFASDSTSRWSRSF